MQVHCAGTEGESQGEDQEGGNIKRQASNLAVNASMSIMEKVSKKVGESGSAKYTDACSF